MEYPFGEGTEISYLAEMYTKSFAEFMDKLYISGKRSRQTGGMDELQRYDEMSR